MYKEEMSSKQERGEWNLHAAETHNKPTGEKRVQEQQVAVRE